MLGFGSKTGVELPGETSGSVKDTSSSLWSARSKPTIAIGQEISVSALQMVQAATAIANGGVVNDHHGVGIKLGRLMKEQYGPAMQVFEGIKKQLDPNGILNPFKLGL